MLESRTWEIPFWPNLVHLPLWFSGICLSAAVNTVLTESVLAVETTIGSGKTLKRGASTVDLSQQASGQIPNSEIASRPIHIDMHEETALRSLPRSFGN